jgi:putative thiamine transport system permease protein
VVAALRFALSPVSLVGLRALAMVPVLLLLISIVPGSLLVGRAVAHVGVWQSLYLDPQWLAALHITLLSSVASTVLALLLAAAVVTLHYPGSGWQALQRRLPLALSIPHAAFAIGLFFLLAPSGWLARAVAWVFSWTAPPAWVTVQDPWGLSLTLALALKESVFFLWVLAALLGQKDIARQLVVGQSLGYRRATIWRTILWPQLLPRLHWSLLAVFAYGLSVVDMALVLGPGNPPTVAVLAWQWLTDPDPAQQARGYAASLVLLLLLLLAVLLYQLLAKGARFLKTYPSGLRRPASSVAQTLLHIPLLSSFAAVVLVLLWWSVAEGWFFPALWPEDLTLRHWRSADGQPFFTTLLIGVTTCLLALPMVLFWLEWGPQRLQALLFIPLVTPVLPLAAGQYATLLAWQWDGHWWAVVWSHWLWVLPYMLLTLMGPYRAFDSRLLLAARALGCSELGACLRVKWPLLLRPIAASVAVGFSVSVAQYLPTLFAGAGRIVTVTTEAVALSAGGNRSVLAVQAVLQMLLPLGAFALVYALSWWAGRYRLGLR